MSISRELLAMVHPHNGIQCNHGKEWENSHVLLWDESEVIVSE
jgi:hypothetical protein